MGKPRDSSFFWEQVEIIENACWMWKGSRTTGVEYGIYYDGKRTYLAHRYMWQIVNGDIPRKMCVLHTCAFLLCCNPEHLYLGTAKIAAQDRMKRRKQKSPWSKLTEDDVRYILRSSDSHYDLSLRFDISMQHVRQIRNGESWLWIYEEYLESESF